MRIRIRIQRNTHVTGSQLIGSPVCASPFTDYNVGSVENIIHRLRDRKWRTAENRALLHIAEGIRRVGSLVKGKLATICRAETGAHPGEARVRILDIKFRSQTGAHPCTARPGEKIFENSIQLMVWGRRNDFSRWGVRCKINLYGIPHGRETRMSQKVEDGLCKAKRDYWPLWEFSRMAEERFLAC
jgi:hypothetical protein